MRKTTILTVFLVPKSMFNTMIQSYSMGLGTQTNSYQTVTLSDLQYLTDKDKPAWQWRKCFFKLPILMQSKFQQGIKFIK